MTAPATRPPRGLRRVERVLVGVAMAVVAVVLERIVMRSVNKKDASSGAPSSTTLTSKGGDVNAG